MCPISGLYNLLLCLHECSNGTHAVVLVRASIYARQRNNTIINDDSYLRVWYGGTRENCNGIVSQHKNNLNEYALDIRWN
jgi:hypothetical protein